MTTAVRPSRPDRTTAGAAGRRRVAVVGEPSAHDLVVRLAPPDLVVVAVAGVEELDRLTSVQWDETVVDPQALTWLRREHPELLAAHPVVVLSDRDPVAAATMLRRPLSRKAIAFKRSLDLVVALLIATLALPLLLLAVVAVRLDSRGPAFFHQQRVGVGGREFRLHKLRTMRLGADDGEHRRYVDALMSGDAVPQDGLYKLVHDPRVTRVGALLRRYSIDELPQLWNVVAGDMSLIGPRPLLPSDAAAFTAGQWARLRVRPGITGPWQVGGRSRLTFEQMIALDVDYWQHWTPWTDLRILLRTPLAVLGRRGTA